MDIETSEDRTPDDVLIESMMLEALEEVSRKVDDLRVELVEAIGAHQEVTARSWDMALEEMRGWTAAVESASTEARKANQRGEALLKCLQTLLALWEEHF